MNCVLSSLVVAGESRTSSPGFPAVFCVAQSQPFLPPLLLGSSSCSYLSSSQSGIPTWASAYAAQHVWWNLHCYSKDQYQQLAAAFKSEMKTWVTAGRNYTEAQISAALQEMAQADRFCNGLQEERVCRQPIVDAPRAAAIDGEKCMDAVPELQKLRQCCGAVENYIEMADTSTSGRLPDTFLPAKVYTNLSNNPGLCGSIKKLPIWYDTVTVINNPPVLVNLYNTSVQLDLAGMSPGNKFLAVQVAYWLGSLGADPGSGPPALSSHNIANMQSSQQSLYVCGLLWNGKLSGVERSPQGNYSTSTGPCTCNSPNAFMDSFKGTWACCHQKQLHLEFDLELQRIRALLHYNANVQRKDPSGGCSPQGQWNRTFVVIIFCFVFVVLFLVFLFVGYCVRRTCNGSCCSGFSLLVRFLLDLTDIGTDCWFIMQLATSGNFYSVVWLGFLLAGSSILQALVCLGAWGLKMDWRKRWITVAVAVVAILLIGSIIPAALTAQFIQAQVGMQAIVLGDTYFLASLLVGMAAPLCFLAAVGSLTYGNDGRCVPLFRRVVFFTEDMPQFAVQAYFWVHAAVAVPMLTYVITGLVTVISLAYGFAEVVLHFVAA